MSETQYYIAQGQDVQGPFGESKVRAYIQAGRVRPEMLFSVNGGDWVKGSTLPALFPAAQPLKRPVAAPPAAAAPPPLEAAPRNPTPPRGAAPARSREARSETPRRARVSKRPQRRPPSGFLTTSIMDFIFAGLGIAGGGWVAFRSGRIIARVRNSPEGIIEMWTNPQLIEQLEGLRTMGWAFVVAGCVALIMGVAIRSGTPEARTAQLVVSFGIIGLCVWALMQRWVSVVTLCGLGAQAAAAFVMLQLKPARGGAERPPPRRRGRRR